MIYSSKNRVGSLRLVLGLAALALSVFLWGLGYQLSRYEPAKANFHKIPRAKLMSEDERSGLASVLVVPGRAAKAIRATSEVVIGAFFLFLFLTSFITFAELNKEIRIRESRKPRQRRCSASLSAFHFRPPPFPAIC